MLLVSSLSAHDGDKLELKREFTKVLKRDFSINQGGTVGLNNKHGKIDVKTWDKQRVKVDVTIVVKAQGESEAQQTFDRISVNWTDSGSKVGATTIIEAKKKSSFNWLWKGNDPNADFKILYLVYVPKDSRMEISAKHCDVTVADVTGASEINVKYGNFRLDGLGEDSNVTLAYGKGSIGEARDLNLTLAHSSCDIGESKDIIAETKHSHLNIGLANDIRSESRYDTYTVGQVRTLHSEGRYDNYSVGYADEIFMDTRYTHLHAREVGQSLDLDMEYGGAKVDLLKKNFSRAQIYGSHTDFLITLEQNMPFQLDASGTYAGIAFPDDMKVTHEVERNASHEVKGHRGDSNANLIKARLTHGGLKVKK